MSPVDGYVLIITVEEAEVQLGVPLSHTITLPSIHFCERAISDKLSAESPYPAQCFCLKYQPSLFSDSSVGTVCRQYQSKLYTAGKKFTQEAVYQSKAEAANL